MGRIVAGTLLGAIALFMWGFVSWVVLQLHDNTLKPLDNEAAVTQVLQAEIAEPGVYVFPSADEPEDATQEQMEQAMEQWAASHRAGPVGYLSIHPDGKEPMSPSALGSGFALNMFMALIASVLLLAASPQRYLMRVLFITSLGLIVGASSRMIDWNYMHTPLDYSLMLVFDSVVGWFLAGLLIAAVVRPARKSPDPASA